MKDILEWVRFALSIVAIVNFVMYCFTLHLPFGIVGIFCLIQSKGD